MDSLPWDMKFFPEKQKRFSVKFFLWNTFYFLSFNKIASKAENRLTNSLSWGDPSGKPPTRQPVFDGKSPSACGAAQRLQPSETAINCCLWVTAHIKKTNDKQSLPKSTSLTPPSVVRRMLFPLTSRWMIRLLCKCWRPCMAFHHHRTGKRKGNFAWLF